MKILYVFYSRSGGTERVISSLRDKLGGESRVISIRLEKSKISFLRAGFHSLTKKSAKITLVSPGPQMSEYDLVIIGTPVWAGCLSSPVRAFLRQNTGAKKTAVVATHSSDKCGDAVFNEVDTLTGVGRCAALAVKAKDPASGGKIDEFAAALRAAL